MNLGNFADAMTVWDRVLSHEYTVADAAWIDTVSLSGVE